MSLTQFQIKEITYKTFQKCIEIRTDLYYLIITKSFGPRIIFFGPNDKCNLLFQDNHDVFRMNNANHHKIFQNDAWHCYGGHRLWASPESIYTYAPDNQPIEVKLKNNKLCIIAPKLPVVNLKIKWEITINPGNIEIKHTIVNQGNKQVELAVWALTQMAPQGVAIFKLNDADTGFLPNRKLVLWPYTRLNDPRLFLGNKYCSLKMDPNNQTPIKLGFDYRIGQAIYLLNNYKFTISYLHDDTGHYPDGGCSCETYTNQHFLEIETLSKLVQLKPKHSITHVETWKLERISSRIGSMQSDDDIAKIFSNN